MPEWVSDFHFLRPLWLIALLPVLLLAWYWARRRASGSHWESTIAPELLAVLLERRGRGPSRRLPWLVAAALAVGALGLAGPTWERLPQPVEQKTDSLVILFDLSLSMFAEDVAPSRLVRARQKIADVLRRREEGFTALVAYAGDAHAVVPLTDDTRTIENLLTSLRPDMMPVLGSDLGEALEQAHVLFDNAGVLQGRILVVTDGIDEVSHATERRDASFPISVLGIGTPAGGHIPLDFVNQPGQVLRTQQGSPVVARLDPERLANVAELSYGRYRTLTLGDEDIADLLDTPLPGEDETAEVERDFDTWADKGYLAALALLPLLLVGFRRGALVGLGAGILPLALLPALALWSPPTRAGLWDDLWQRRDQQAFAALRDGSPDTAAGLFERDDWRAAALYRNEQYQAAAEAYQRQPSVTAQYNLGNALARQGDYDGALDAYDRVLSREPDHADAAFNRDLIERLKDEQTQAREDQESREQQGESQPEEQAQQNGGEPQQNQQDQQQGQPQQQPPEEQARTEEERSEESRQGEEEQQLAASRDEKQDALEQWLRRVPDDPGGLLRRKFQYETNQRLRQGDYRSQDSDKIW